MTKKNVFITGAASGIGLATAQLLYQQGYLVGMGDIDLPALKAVTQSWDQTAIALYELDVTNYRQAKAVLGDFCKGKHLSILINNAGILEIGDFEKISNKQHARIIDVNIMGVINMCQAAFYFLNKSETATVINVSSASSDYGVPQLSSYSASKFAVKALTEALEIEWQPHNIRVCDVVPDFVSTAMVKSQTNTSRILQRLGVHLTAADVAKVIAKQIEKPRTHRVVGMRFGLLQVFNNLSPAFIRRLIMRYLNRP